MVVTKSSHKKYDLVVSAQSYLLSAYILDCSLYDSRNFENAEPHRSNKKSRTGFYLCAVQDSNLRPDECKSTALPTELTAQCCLVYDTLTFFSINISEPPSFTYIVN